MKIPENQIGQALEPGHGPFRALLHEVIFEADTPAGKIFDVALILSIVVSVLVVMLDSVASIREAHGPLLYGLEWLFTLAFTLEYLLRLYCVGRPWRYATSFFGVVDLLAILPTFLNLLVPGTRYLLVIRALRTIRIWRILKLAQYISELNLILTALKASLKKIVVFLVTVLCLVVILGSLMYIIEPAENGFTSIPRSIYWAIVTLTTVGYGDISPQTGLGQFLAAVAMVLGYSIIAVPTGIVTVELAHAAQRPARPVSTQVCRMCAREGHDTDAEFCKYCGAKL